DGKTLASGEPGGRIALWDVESGWEVGILQAENGGDVRWGAFHPDGQTLAASGENGDGSIRVGGPGTAGGEARPEGRAQAGRSCGGRGEGGLLAGGGGVDGTVGLWNMPGRPPRARVLPVLPA